MSNKTYTYEEYFNLDIFYERAKSFEGNLKFIVLIISL